MTFLLLAAALISIAPVNAPQPNRQPALTSVGGLTALVFGSGNSILFAASHDNGRTFSSPSEVARVPVLALGRHRGPRVAISGSTIIVSAVYGEKLATAGHAHGLPADGDLVAWRSTDGGRSWSKPVVINDSPGSAREGLQSIVAGSGGALAAVWLDLRSPGTRLFGAYSPDNGASWSRNRLLFAPPGGSICQCCAPSLVFSEEKQLLVMFRNIYKGTRDMHVVRWSSEGQVSEPKKLGTGAWTIDACPMDGGGIAKRGNAVFTAWRRDKTVYLDEVDRPEVALGEGKDVALAGADKGFYVAWTGPGGVQLYRQANRETLPLAAGGSFPALTALSTGSALVAWEQDGKIELKVVE